MSALSIQPTYPIFTETDGQPLENGYIWIGAVNLNPIVNPIAAFFDAALTIPAVQPIRTSGGYPVYQGTPARLYVNSDYSIQVQNKNGSLIYGAPVCTDRILASLITFQQPDANSIERTVQQKLEESYSVNDFISLADAAASGRTLNVPVGTYNITTNIDFGNSELIFQRGALFNISVGVQVIIRKQVICGDYQVFSTTGNIICAGSVNPMWWGAVDTGTDPGPTIAAANTLAFRRAAKSFYTDYAAIITEAISFSVEIPAGAFFLSNGFAATVGVPVRGKGCNTLICRLAANADADTAIPLLTIGRTLGAPPTLAEDPVTQNESSLKNAGFPFTAAQASHLYFVDQNPTVAAFKPSYPGCQFSDLFFTSCGIAIDMSATADVTGENLIIDMGLTGIVFGATANVVLNNVILYNQVSQAIVFGTNARDITINGFEIEYPQSMGILFSESQNNNDNIRFANGSFISNIQYAGFLGMVNIRGGNSNMFFNNCSFRNVPGIAINQSLGAAGVRITCEDCTFDGLRTTSAYNQGSTMRAFSTVNATMYFKGCEFKNLFQASTSNIGSTALTFQSCKYSGMNYSGAVFDFSSGSGTADFIAIEGDNVSPLVSGNGLFSRVKGSFDWLGTPYADSTNLSWNVPTGLGNQYYVTVTARTNSALAVESRKSATYLVDKQIAYTGSAFNDSLSSQLIYATPADGTYGQVVPTFNFLAGGTTQATSYPNPTTWKVSIPNTYADYKISVEFLN